MEMHNHMAQGQRMYMCWSQAIGIGMLLVWITTDLMMFSWFVSSCRNMISLKVRCSSKTKRWSMSHSTVLTEVASNACSAKLAHYEGELPGYLLPSPLFRSYALWYSEVFSCSYPTPGPLLPALGQAPYCGMIGSCALEMWTYALFFGGNGEQSCCMAQCWVRLSVRPWLISKQGTNLSICGVLEGVKDLFESHCISGFLIHRFPYHSVCLHTRQPTLGRPTTEILCYSVEEMLDSAGGLPFRDS